jgi:hypothetical protein
MVGFQDVKIWGDFVYSYLLNRGGRAILTGIRTVDSKPYVYYTAKLNPEYIVGEAE